MNYSCWCSRCGGMLTSAFVSLTLTGSLQASSLAVTPGAAKDGAFGLEVTVSTDCPVDLNLEITPPPATISGPHLACETLTASGVEVVSPGATFAAKHVALGDGFSIAPDAPFSVFILNLGTVEPAYVQDDRPRHEGFYAASFFVDSDRLMMMDPGDSLKQVSSHAADGTELFWLELVHDQTSPSGTSAITGARLDDGSFSRGSIQPLPRGYNEISLRWVQDPGGDRGELELAVNSGPFVGEYFLDNGNLGLDTVRVGALGGNLPSIPGAFYFDDFASFRTLRPDAGSSGVQAPVRPRNLGSTPGFTAPPPVVGWIETAVEGSLEQCDTVKKPVNRLLVTFFSGLPIVNFNVLAYYVLLQSGANGIFDTSACDGAPAGDDELVEIAGAWLRSSPDPVTWPVDIRTNGSLVRGLYRLLVCDEITNDEGEALDGDEDGNPGGDYKLSFFGADPLNLFENGGFDNCPVTLDPWQPVATSPNAIVPGSPGVHDWMSAADSSSVKFTHSAPGISSIGQCMPIREHQEYDFQARVRFDPAGAATAILERSCEFFAAPDCTGGSLGSSSFPTLVEDEGGRWVLVTDPVTAPGGALSGRCEYAIGPAGSDHEFDAFLDELSLALPELIFADGFESGDTTAWSSSTPP